MKKCNKVAGGETRLRTMNKIKKKIPTRVIQLDNGKKISRRVQSALRTLINIIVLLMQ